MGVPLLHITSRSLWEVGGGPYRDASLASEGFIHCSTPEQVLIPANDRFAGVAGLVLLVIDPRALRSEAVFEDCYESGVAFPHVYGPIERDAVVDVVDFPPSADGSFEMPVITSLI